jgi:hypothetical protein
MSEDRVDGQHLQALTEPGSDDLLSADVKLRIQEVIAEWVAAHGH